MHPSKILTVVGVALNGKGSRAVQLLFYICENWRISSVAARLLLLVILELLPPQLGSGRAPNATNKKQGKGETDSDWSRSEEYKLESFQRTFESGKWHHLPPT
jgi:hypothetical protein